MTEQEATKRKPKRLPVAISEEEFTELIKATKTKHHRLAFLLGFGAGMRITEIVKLEPRNVDIDASTIFVEQGKGGKDRVVPLPKGFRQEHLNLLPLPCRQRALQIAFKRSAKRSGLLNKKPSAHFHSLRHGFGSNAASKNIPIHHIRTLMGHANIQTTNVYLEMNPKEALKSYGEFF